MGREGHRKLKVTEISLYICQNLLRENRVNFFRIKYLFKKKTKILGSNHVSSSRYVLETDSFQVYHRRGLEAELSAAELYGNPGVKHQ